MTEGRVVVQSISSMSQVEAAAWDALVGEDNPFVEHAFLYALEGSGSVGEQTGWVPQHLLVWREEAAGRRLIGAAPMYVKDNSYGEYIFDWGWAEGAQRAGLSYYPKLVSAVPHTPATGPRMLVHPEAEIPEVVRALTEGARSLADHVGASSIHWLFSPAEQAEALVPHGYMHRLSYQFHWDDQGYTCFDDYLGALRSKRRKEVRRERRDAQRCGLDIGVVSAADLTEAELDLVYRCYRNTVDDHRAIPYLTSRWFHGLGRALGHSAKVALARRDGRIVAMALAFHKGSHLYGRYWGSVDAPPGVHFELCYYRLVQWGIERGVTHIEAGAQGQHKIRRGFLPALTHSAHWIRHPGLADAVKRFVAGEAEHVQRTVDSLAEQTPYKREES